MKTTINDQLITIETLDDLIQAKTTDPHAALQLSLFLYRSPETIQKLTPTLEDFLQIVDIFPEDKSLLFKRFFFTEEGLKRLLSNRHDLLATPEKLLSLASTLEDFILIAASFENDYTVLLDVLFANEKELKRLLPTHYELQYFAECLHDDRDAKYLAMLFSYLFTAPGEYERLVSTELAYYDIIERFPLKTEQFIERLLQPEEVERLKLSSSYLYALLRDIPGVSAYANKFMGFIQKHEQYYKKFVLESHNTFQSAATFFIDYHGHLLNSLFISKEEFNRLTPSLWYLKLTVWLFPNNKQQFANYLLNTPGEIERLAAWRYDFFDIAELFPENASEFSCYLFNTPGLYQEVISIGSCLGKAGQVFAADKHKFMQWLFQTAQEFQRVIKDVRHVITLVEVFSDYKQQILEFILKQPGEFKRLFTFEYEVRELIKLCPEYKDQLEKKWRQTQSELNDNAISNVKAEGMFSSGYTSSLAKLMQQPEITPSISAVLGTP